MNPLKNGHPVQWSREFVLENDTSAIGPLIALLREKSQIIGLQQRAAAGLAIAIEEALLNSIQHGNLEVSSELRDNDVEAFFELVDQRRSELPYSQRRVWLKADYHACHAVFEIRDEGPGFSVKDVPDPRKPANLERPGGRGILLMREYMDEVRYNQKGNEVRLVKRR